MMNARMRPVCPTFWLLATTALALLATTTTAAPMTGATGYTYETQGEVLAGPSNPAIWFYGVHDNPTLTTPGTFSLGSFRVLGVRDGQTTEFKNVAFNIGMNFRSNDPAIDLSNVHLGIHGLLNGTVTGDTSSDLTATLTSISAIGPMPFDTPEPRVLVPQILAPVGVNGGMTSLNVYLGPTSQPPSIPEPTTLAIFGVVLAVAGVHRYRRR